MTVVEVRYGSHAEGETTSGPPGRSGAGPGGRPHPGWSAAGDRQYNRGIESLKIFIGTDQSQVVAHRVLEYTIRKHATVPVQITPMLNFEFPAPTKPEFAPRTAFSYSRFIIPELAGYQGRALYLDADMVVFASVEELTEIPFGDQTVLLSTPPRTELWDSHDTEYLGSRSVAVMLLDCDRLRWDATEIVRGLDEGKYTYAELMSDMCIVGPDGVGERIPAEWNHLEHYDPGRTRLLHYTVVPSQPWKVRGNPLEHLWLDAYREALDAGALPLSEVEAGVAAGHIRPDLLEDLPARVAAQRNWAITGPRPGTTWGRVRRRAGRLARAMKPTTP